VQGITLQSVSRHFGAVAAVERIDLEVKQGEFVTLLGPSGCGKTTTLRMVAGLEENDEGRIWVGDQLVSDPEARLFVQPDQRRLGMVFQSYAIWPHMTVFDNVGYPLRIRHRSAAEIKEKTMGALRLVEMERFADRPAPLLSGGQQQRVAIARALVFEPQVLLLDEPLSNLDAKLRMQTGDEFRDLQRRLGITTLYVTHDQSEAMALSDRVVVMEAGRVLQIGAPEEVYERPASRSVATFFGSPNLMEGRVVSDSTIGGARFEFMVKGEGWQGRCLAGEAFAAGDKVLVMVRPENLRIVPTGEPSGDEISWRGRIADSIFRGAQRSVRVDIGRQHLQVETRALQSAPPGQDVTITVEPGGAWALRP